MVRAWGKRKAQERRLREDGLRRQLSKAQLLLERDPDSHEAQTGMVEALANLKLFEKARESWMAEVTQSKWINQGDRCSKAFFKSFRGLSASSEIHEIFDSQGQLKRGWEQVSDTATEFFRSLLGILTGD